MAEIIDGLKKLKHGLKLYSCIVSDCSWAGGKRKIEMWLYQQVLGSLGYPTPPGGGGERPPLDLVSSSPSYTTVTFIVCLL